MMGLCKKEMDSSLRWNDDTLTPDPSPRTGEGRNKEMKCIQV